VLRTFIAIVRKSVSMCAAVVGAFTAPTMKTVETSEMDAGPTFVFVTLGL